MAEITEHTPAGTHQDNLPKPSAALKKKRAKKKKVRRVIITLIVILAIIGGIAYGMYRLFREEETAEEVQTGFIMRGSIQSTVTGGGQAMPKDSATITLTSGGTVLEVFVSDGDLVNEGDPLYIIDSTAAVAALEDAQKAVNNLQKQLDSIMKSYDDLEIYAEFSGTLIETSKISTGDTVSPGVIATLVDDSHMKLELEFSYAYKDEITVGQSARVSIPKTMNELSGTVTEINMVRRVSPEGSLLFRATIEVENPGSLADGMEGSAVLFGSDGLEIYPYAGGALTYSRSVPVTAKASGTALTVNLLDYSQVKAGELLLEIDAESNDDTVATLENQLRTAQGTLERAQTSLDNFNAVAPMSGTVLSCTLRPGETVDSGRVAITIANTATMVVEARIDEMNVAYVKPGMFCEVTQYSRNDMLSFMGIVDSVSLEGKYENGMSYFPAVITVENPEGTLMAGMYVEYNLVASQSDNCLLAPVQAVKYTGEGVCLFVKSETPPPNALDAETLGIEIPEGFYPVPVTIGISDNYNVEILDGVEEMTEVFTQLAPSGGGMGGMGGGMIRIG